MTTVDHGDLRKRLRRIEDRKIEILMEVADRGEGDEARLRELDAEYARLDLEHYRIRMELFRRGRTRFLVI